MLNLAIGFVAGAVVAVISPPLFRFVAAKVVEFKAWIASRP